MNRRALALGLLLGGSLLILATSWADSRAGQNLPQALALVVLVGSVLILVLGVRGRRVAGLLLAAGGLAMAAAAAIQSGTSVSALVAYAFGGLLVTSGGLLTMITGGRWPAAADRFERSQTATSAGTDNPADLWQAMDAGLDPTADPDVRKDDSGDTMRSANQS
jgi:Tryptophan-associated transmembrane protein (Trp_oprn_chp)